MSVKISAGDFTKADVFGIDPGQITVEQALNGRRDQHNAEAVKARAESLLRHGQIHNITVRKVKPDNRVCLVAGYLRHAAASLINELLAEDTLAESFPDIPADTLPVKPFKLTCRVISDVNEEDAFRLNVEENMSRAELTAMDFAHHLSIFVHRFEWDTKRIAEFYRKTPAWVSQTRALLEAPGQVQQAVADGELPAATARMMSGLPETEQRQIIRESANGDGHLDPATVKEKVREKKEAAGKKLARSLKDVKAFFDRYTVEGETEPKLRELSISFLEFIGGGIGERAMAKRFESSVGE